MTQSSDHRWVLLAQIRRCAAGRHRPNGLRLGRGLPGPQAGPDLACVMPAPDREVLVGVALFGGAGLEALGRLPAPGGGSVLEQVAYLSSVSGGSVAAAYYASQKPPRETAVLTPEDTLTEAYETFFANYGSPGNGIKLGRTHQGFHRVSWGIL